MKKILLILLMLLPIVGNTGDTSVQEKKPYNVKFVEALYDGMMDHDFTDLGDKYFDDHLIFYIESDSTQTIVSRESLVGTFNYILQNTVMYSFYIEPALGEDGIFYYTLSHTVVTQGTEEDGMGLGVAIFTFSSSNNDKIDRVYGL